jgi:hypothetical protein
LGNFFNRKSHVLILAKNGLGYTLVGFFTNSSGHPAYAAEVFEGKLFSKFVQTDE